MENFDINMVDEKDVQKLVVETVKGDSEAFGKLYDLFAGKIFSFILNKTKHKQTAEDLLHTVFLKAWNSLPRYKPSKTAKFSTWLYQIANYTVIDHWRTKKETVEIEKVENLSQLAVSPEKFEQHDFLWEAIKKLSDDYQTVLNLRFKEDLSVTETAYIMNKSEVGIRVLQFRALKALREKLKPYMQD